MATQSRVAIVTGANKGIGLAIERGAEAVKTLQNDAQLKAAKVLVDQGGDTAIKFRALDISDNQSIENFVRFMKDEHPEGVDVVINNAGIAMNGFDNNVVKTTLATNYYGTLAVTSGLLPQIRSGGRLVNVASMAGHLNRYTDKLQKAFITASQTSVAACSELMEKFTNDVQAGTHKDQGWPSAGYAVSKAGVIAFTKAKALEEEKNGRGVLVNACCPGWVVTDMTRGAGTKNVDQGATTPVMLGLQDIQGKTGLFWQNERPIQW